MLYITGAFDSASVGYTQAALQYLMALKTSGYNNFQLSQVGGGVTWRLLPAWTEPLAYARQTTEDHTNIGVVHWLPEYLINPVFLRGRKRNYGLTVPEADRVPAWLTAKYNAHLAGLIVPTEWQKQVLADSGYSGPIEVLPHALGSYFHREVVRFRHLMAETERPYTFYYTGTWVARKNPVAVLRAYLRAFPVASPDVRLVLKISRCNGLQDYVAAVVRGTTGSTTRLEQDVQFIDDEFTDEQMAWLHAAGDCFVSAHRSEGWGYGLHQAAVAGNRVIATGWSAPLAYLQPWVDILVPYRMAPVATEGTASSMALTAVEGDAEPEWAMIDEDALVAAFQQAARERKVRSVEDTQVLRDAYSWEAVGAKFRAFLERVENEVRST